MPDDTEEPVQEIPPGMWRTTAAEFAPAEFGFTFRTPRQWGGSIFYDERRPKILTGDVLWSIYEESVRSGSGNHVILLHVPHRNDSVLYCADKLYYLSSSLWDKSERLGEDYSSVP